MLQTVERTKLEDIMMAMVGLETTAYIKKIVVDGITAFAVYAADGTQLAAFDTEEKAYYTAIKHNLEPASIH